uniref:Uncharacterized protein n=1 Tax=Vespula pensylvanica TaxID=30213 RepID=A0A834NIP0_VESPE|nr:hypothetical protein H0235_014101 [Vespula pensylvanica]
MDEENCISRHSRSSVSWILVKLIEVKGMRFSRLGIDKYDANSYYRFSSLSQVAIQSCSRSCSSTSSFTIVLLRETTKEFMTPVE